MLVRADKTHRAFVISTWVRSVVEVSHLPKHLVHRHEPKLAEEVCDGGGVWVETSDGYAVNGWLAGWVGKPGLLHWIYVPPELRGLGVATSMLQGVYGAAAPEVSKEWTRHRKAPQSTRLQLGTFNPYRILELPKSPGNR